MARIRGLLLPDWKSCMFQMLTKRCKKLTTFTVRIRILWGQKEMDVVVLGVGSLDAQWIKQIDCEHTSVIPVKSTARMAVTMWVADNGITRTRE